MASSITSLNRSKSEMANVMKAVLFLSSTSAMVLKSATPLASISARLFITSGMVGAMFFSISGDAFMPSSVNFMPEASHSDRRFNVVTVVTLAGIVSSSSAFFEHDDITPSITARSAKREKFCIFMIVSWRLCRDVMDI